jgi:intein/homing endonuclease
LKRLQLELEKIGRRFDNVCDEDEAEALIKLGEAKFREAKKIEKRLLEEQELQTGK